MDNEDRMAILQYPYSRHQRDDGGYDLNLNWERWQLARTKLDIFDWAELCNRGRDAAKNRI